MNKKLVNVVFANHDAMMTIAHGVSDLLQRAPQRVELRYSNYVIFAAVSVLTHRVCVSIFNTTTLQFVLNHETRSLTYNVNKLMKLL